MPNAVIDLFCGVGGLTKGLELANLNVIAGIDIDKNCEFAYERNNNSHFIHSDISLINPNDIGALYPPHTTRILVGCAPCQPFSKYTQRYRKNGHTDNKWKLLYSFSDIIEVAKPSIISMENVPELTKENVFEDFTTYLSSRGYHYSWKIVFCPDYGVPQKRKRLVLLASLLGDIELIPPTHTPDNYLTVRDAIGFLPQLRHGEIDQQDPLHSSTKLSPINLKRIQQSRPGGTWKDWEEQLRLPCHKKPSGKSYSSVYGRMQWNEPSPTITTQFYGYGNGRFGHPEQDRAISYREGALLQSFPIDYQFIDPEHPITKKILGTHIGNAVPVELGRVIGLSIQQHLNIYGG